MILRNSNRLKELRWDGDRILQTWTNNLNVRSHRWGNLGQLFLRLETKNSRFIMCTDEGHTWCNTLLDEWSILSISTCGSITEKKSREVLMKRQKVKDVTERSLLTALLRICTCSVQPHGGRVHPRTNRQHAPWISKTYLRKKFITCSFQHKLKWVLYYSTP